MPIGGLIDHCTILAAPFYDRRRWCRSRVSVGGSGLLCSIDDSARKQHQAVAIGVFWFLLKVAVMIYIMIWFRGTFPRFRYDQLMNIGWKVMIPVGMAAIVVNALLGMTHHPPVGVPPLGH